MKKVCVKCKNERDVGFFRTDLRYTSGLASWCSYCKNKSTRAYRLTEKGVLSYIYSNQVRNSKRRRHAAPEYNLTEFRDRYIDDNDFKSLFRAWAESGYLKSEFPSFDRADDSKPYSFSNFRKWCRFKDNHARAIADMKDGALVNNHVGVVQKDKSGEIKGVYVSQIAAARETGINNRYISRCVSGKTKTAGGFIWERR